MAREEGVVKQTLTIRMVLAPDMRALMDYIGEAIPRLEDANDPRADAVLREVAAARHGLAEVVQERGGVSIIPGDELMRLAAKMRAVERVVFR